MRFADQAQFHPRRYCLALARLIDADGSRVFEQKRAVDVEEGSPCVVKTDRHDVRAASSVSPDELAPGDGQVTSAGAEQLAVARDGQGTLHSVSARCTDTGCIVHWNPAETTWDCPCHGSRFSVEGKVIEGPAVDDLERREIT